MKIKDQLEREITFNKSPERIICLVPSITHMLCYLGLQKKIVGRTKFCIYPESLDVLKLGGTKNPNIQKIRALSPDLILVNKEENKKEDVLTLAQDFNVYISDINHLEDFYIFLDHLGTLFNVEDKIIDFKNLVKKEITSCKNIPSFSFLYFIWKDPYYIVGNQTYINQLFQLIGWKNMCQYQHNKNRYPELENLAQLESTEKIMLSSEPYPFKQQHMDEFQKKFPKSKIHLVPGEVFSWYSPFILKLEETLWQIVKQ